MKNTICVLILFLLLTVFLKTPLSAQIPLVYNVENTGAACTKPALPTLANLTAYAMLPDPFRWANGSGRIRSFAEWACRRNEIKAQIENYEIGVKPTKPANITATWAAGTNTLTVRVTENGQALTLTSRIVLPAGTGPFPAVIGMNSSTGSLPASAFSSRNIAQITYNHDQVTTYNNKSANDPFYRMYPTLASNGQYSAWAWGVSRIIDGLELVQAQLPIDLKHIAVTGCSYAGKMALFSGALDERIALTIPVESGGGGSAAWRVSETLGAVEKLGATNFQWFMQSMSQFQGNNVPRLPHDHHELLAMVAPRALLVLGNSPDWVWLAEEASYVSARAAEDVYKTLGIPERFGFSQVGGHGHCEFPSTQNGDLGAFLDKFLLNKTANTTIFKHLFPNTDYNRWITAWKGLVVTPPNNNAPVVTISAPLNNASYTEGDNITIHATATVPTGTISKVDFYEGTTLLGTDASAPYTFTWNTVAGGKYAITAKATSAANDVGTSSIIQILVTKAVFQTGAVPVVDGTVDAIWGNHTAVPILNVLGGTVSSAADLSGNWKAMWDATNLYVLVQVTDDVKRNDAGTDVYNDDGVEIYIDFGNNKPTDYGANDHQYTFRWNDAAAAYEINGHSVAGIVKAMTNTATGYITEVSIPWTTIGGVPTANSLQGFDVMINDDDNGTARDKKMAWTATADDTWDNPSLMGTIVLKALTCTPPAASISVTGTTTVCSGSAITLNANAGTGFTYVWKKDNAEIAGATAVSYGAAVSGSYTVSVTLGSCSATSTPTVVTVHSVPSAPVAASVLTYCQNAVATELTATGTALKWYETASSSLALANTPVPATTTAGTKKYYVSQTVNGCESSRAELSVTVNALPIAWVIAGTATTFCTGSSVTLTASAGSSYVWKSASGQVGTGASYIATESGSYVAEVTNAANCKATSPATVVMVHSVPSVPVIVSDLAYCQNAVATQLMATGTALKWYEVASSGSALANTPVPATTTAGTKKYYVSQTVNGCESSRAELSVTVNALPIASVIAGTATTFCTGGSVTLTASAGSSYIWKSASGQVGTGASFTATTSGSYSVEVTNTHLCTAISDPVRVTVNPLPLATITTVGSTTIGSGSSVLLQANSGTGLTYKWFDGTTMIGAASSYEATAAGNYSVEVTNAADCRVRSSVVVVTAGQNQPSVVTIISPVQHATITGAVTIDVVVSDPDGSITLVEFLDGNEVVGTSTTEPYTFTWNNPSVGSHTLTVRVTDSQGGATTSEPVTIMTSVATSNAYTTVISANVYPVPAREHVLVETDTDLSGASVRVINMLGEDVAVTSQINQKNVALNVSALSEGTYLLIITHNSSIMTTKVTVMK